MSYRNEYTWLLWLTLVLFLNNSSFTAYWPPPSSRLPITNTKQFLFSLVGVVLFAAVTCWRSRPSSTGFVMKLLFKSTSRIVDICSFIRYLDFKNVSCTRISGTVSPHLQLPDTQKRWTFVYGFLNKVPRSLEKSWLPSSLAGLQSSSCHLIHFNCNTIMYEIRPITFKIWDSFISPYRLTINIRFTIRQRRLVATLHHIYRFHHL